MQLSAILITLMWMAQQQTELDMAAARANIVVCQAAIALIGTIASMSTLHGYRRMFRTPHVHNQGQYEMVMTRMVHENPGQFYRTFRMQPDTFFFLREALWETLYPNEGRRAGARPVGDKPHRDVFER